MTELFWLLQRLNWLAILDIALVALVFLGCCCWSRPRKPCHCCVGCWCWG